MKRLPYPLLQAFLWGTYGVLQTYINRCLLAAGLSNTLIGAVLGLSTAAAFLLQPLLGALTDKRRLTVRQALLLCSVLMLACSAALLAPAGTNATVALYAAANTLLSVLPAFVNALGVQGVRAGLPINLGISRGIGSVAYSAVAQAAGWLVAARGLRIVPALSALLIAGMGVTLLAFPRVDQPAGFSAPPAGGFAAFLRRNPGMLLFLTASILLGISHSAIRNAMYQIARWKGDVNAQGTAMALGALLELPVMAGFSRMLTKRRCGFWLRLCAVFYTVRGGLLLLLPGVRGLYIAQCAQPLGSALYIIASVYYVAQTLEGEDAVRGQWHTGAAGTLASLLAYVSSGALLDRVSLPVLLSAVTALAAAGTLAMFAAVGRMDRAFDK